MPRYAIDHQTFLLLGGMTQGQYLVGMALWQGGEYQFKKTLIRRARAFQRKHGAGISTRTLLPGETMLVRQQHIRDVKAMQDFLDRHPVIETEVQNEEALKLVEPAFASQERQALFSEEERAIIEKLTDLIAAFEDQHYPISHA